MMNGKWNFQFEPSDVYMIRSNGGVDIRTQIRNVLYWVAHSHGRSIACYDEKFGFDIEPGDTVDSILEFIRKKTTQTK